MMPQGIVKHALDTSGTNLDARGESGDSAHSRCPQKQLVGRKRRFLQNTFKTMGGLPKRPICGNARCRQDFGDPAGVGKKPPS
jgi:hypothetical protein